MNIKSIKIENFRIYKNTHSLFFSSDENKNLFVISGNNGYGKTTFLTTLVWCLYGKNMKDVDEVYRAQINDAGGYARFIQSCLNRLAVEEGEKSFEVEIQFENVSIPSVPCNEITIKRTGHYTGGTDELEILIDGSPNELTKEVGNEIFVQDFILPREVAKFFFFDSEKIVSLAEIKTIADKRQLSKAYSEVLGIKKYENLRKNLQDLTIRFRKSSANPKEQKKFEELSKDIKKIENEVLEIKIELDRLEDERLDFRKTSRDLQEKLIRKGSSLSLDEMNNLKIDKGMLYNEIERLKLDFKDLLDLAPFAIAGDLTQKVEKQLVKEQKSISNEIVQKTLNKKETEIQDAIAKFEMPTEISTNEIAHEAYKQSFINIISDILSSKKVKRGKTKILHGFTEKEGLEYQSLLNQLRTTYSERIKNISQKLRDKRMKYSKVSRQLSDAESKESDGVIAKYRDEKVIVDEKLIINEKKSQKLHQQIGSFDNDLASKKKVYEELAKKIKVLERFKEKDKLTKKLIVDLDKFLMKIKKEKKSSLEERILGGLRLLMHKSDFIQRVGVEIDNDIIDINLYNSRDEEINKDSLSKGEQQLYATSILKALVEESNVEFPVFIDSPLQKFDSLHAKNIIENFYPTISKQVVLLPLLNKEMTEKEYDLMKHKVKSAYLILNEHEDLSYFSSVNPLKLFSAAKKLQAHVF